MTSSNPTPHILITLPDHDFDPTESATPWKMCSERGWQVSFATENGTVAAADHRLLKGPILGPLGAGPKGLAAYRQMVSILTRKCTTISRQHCASDSRQRCTTLWTDANCKSAASKLNVKEFNQFICTSSNKFLRPRAR